jgi:ornithine carbamoyltransferase
VTRDLLTIDALSDHDVAAILASARTPPDPSILAGRGVALVFERPSLRTRAASSAAVYQLGGFATFFSDEEIGLDTRESAEDVARTLAETFPVAALRLRSHRAFARMRAATDGRLRLINLLSDTAHPTQAFADVLALADHFAGGDPWGLAGLDVAYVGDATNVTRSLAIVLMRLGVNVHVGAPEGYQLFPGGDEDPLAWSGPGALHLTGDARDAVKGCQAVYTDAWVSMGLEAETARRRRDLVAFRVDDALLDAAEPDAVVMHCLPAHRGDEVTDSVLDGRRSLVWRQVFHRRTAMVGVLKWIAEEWR